MSSTTPYVRGLAASILVSTTSLVSWGCVAEMARPTESETAGETQSAVQQSDCPPYAPNCNPCEFRCRPYSSCSDLCVPSSGMGMTCGDYGICTVPSQCSQICSASSNCNMPCRNGTVDSSCSAFACDVKSTCTREDRVDPGRWITSTVNFHKATGVTDVSTLLSNSKSLVGFTGGAIVAIVDANKMPIYATELQSWGLDACGFRCPRTRQISWGFTVSEDVRARAAGVAILQRHEHTNRAFFKSIRFLQKTSEICAGISGLSSQEEIAAACELGAASLAGVDDLFKDDPAEARLRMIDEMMGDVKDKACMF